MLDVFDGGVFAILENDRVASHAGIKDKGLIQEIAVGTEPEFQRRGFGKAVVAAAIRHILAQGKVVVYIPDNGRDPEIVKAITHAEYLTKRNGASTA